MSPAAVILLSFSMSTDAFAVSVGRGASLNQARVSEALRTGAIFGIVEAITPLLGWLAGIAAAGWVSHFDHWLAFGLLGAVGSHMIYSAFKKDDARADEASKPSLLVLVATALGTSIDAMAVGMSLAFIAVGFPEILWISIAIGFATCVLSTIGLLLGKIIGSRFGATAEVCAGLVLCTLGSLILYEHLIGQAG